jgi:hypothetical protein
MDAGEPQASHAHPALRARDVRLSRLDGRERLDALDLLVDRVARALKNARDLRPRSPSIPVLVVIRELARGLVVRLGSVTEHAAHLVRGIDVEIVLVP